MFRSSNKIINSGSAPPVLLLLPSSLGRVRLCTLWGSWTLDLLLAQANEITTINGPAWWCDTHVLFLFRNDQIQNLLVIRQISTAYIANGWNIFHRVVVFLHWVITGDIRWHYESFEEILLRIELRVVLGDQCKLGWEKRFTAVELSHFPSQTSRVLTCKHTHIIKKIARLRRADFS